jgi:gliding motility-associated-like protein
LGIDFSSPIPECILSIIQGQAVPPSNFNYVLTTSTAPTGGNNGVITSALPANLNPFGFTVGEPIPVSTGTTICSGTAATLTASFPAGNTHFNWYSSSTGGTLLLLDNPMFVTPNLFSNTTYYLEYYDSLTLCSSPRIPVLVAVTSAFNSAFSLPDSVCRGENTLITFSGTVSSTATYYWDFDGGILVSGSGSSNQVVYWNDPGFKNITLTINANPCNSSLTMHTVNVMPTPTPAVITTTAYAICKGDSVTLTASGSVGGNVSYNFYDTIAGGNIVGTSPFIVKPQKTITYYLEVVNEHGCKSAANRDSIAITVYPAPDLSQVYIDGVTICYGASTHLYVISDSLPATNIYWWDSSTGGNFVSNNDTIFTGNLFSDITYWVEAVTSHGCTNSGGRMPVNVTIEPLPVETLQSNMENNTIYIGQEMIITASPSIYPAYQFYINNQMVQSGSSNIYSSYAFHNGDVVKISALTDLQCQGKKTDSLLVKVIPYANAFTPDGDGINDLFLKGIDLIIMNRWGQELFRGTQGWDGNYNGTKVSSGTYYYIIKITGPDKTQITQTGPVTLIAD